MEIAPLRMGHSDGIFVLFAARRFSRGGPARAIGNNNNAP
jgi:hypothetical protein